MRKFLVTLFLMISFSVVFGGKAYDTVAFKQLIASSLKSDNVTPLNAVYCPNGYNDILNNCYLSDYEPCPQAQNSINCAYNQVLKDCGKDKATEFCKEFMANIQGNCNGLYCSANSLFISGSIVAILLYKMFFERLFLTD